MAIRLIDAGCLPFRRWSLAPTTVARRIGIREGMRVLVVEPRDWDVARAIAREVGPSGAVETGTTVLPFADESFDAICLVSALGRPSDPRRIVREAWRVLRPTGRLSVSDVICSPAYRLRGSVERWGGAVGFQYLERYGNLLSYTVNLRKPLGAASRA